MEDVEVFHDAMSVMNIPKLSVISDKARFASAYFDIERLRVRKGVNITKDILGKDLKKLGQIYLLPLKKIFLSIKLLVII